MKFFKSFFLILTIINVSYCQIPSVEWSKYYGGNYGEAKSIQKTLDGGYIIAGNAENSPPEVSNYHGGFDGFIVKLNSNFIVEWSNCYGTASYEQINQIKQTTDGGFIFVGRARVEYPNQTNLDLPIDFWIVKINNLGVITWEKKYGGSREDSAIEVNEAPNNEYIISGSSRSVDGDVGAALWPSNYSAADFWVLKLNSLGEIVLSKRYGGNDNDFGFGSVVNTDGSFLIAGQSFSKTGQVTCRSSVNVCAADFWIAKSSNLGTLSWSKCFTSLGSPSNAFINKAKSIIKTSDGGYAIIGSGYDTFTSNTFGGSDIWLIKIDNLGNVQWRQNYGGSLDEESYSIKETLNGGYIIAGTSFSNDNQVIANQSLNFNNGWVIKTNSVGDLLWQKVIGSTSLDYLNDVIQINGNEYLVCGKTQGNDFDAVNSNNRGFWISKITTNVLQNDNFSLSNLEIYPNPTNDILNFKSSNIFKKVIIFDSLGRVVYELNASNLTECNISELKKGIYTLKISSDKNAIIKKIIKD